MYNYRLCLQCWILEIVSVRLGLCRSGVYILILLLPHYLLHHATYFLITCILIPIENCQFLIMRSSCKEMTQKQKSKAHFVNLWLSHGNKKKLTNCNAQICRCYGYFARVTVSNNTKVAILTVFQTVYLSIKYPVLTQILRN